jgi:nucleosome binding factor SPN SPT16 subunit
MAEEIVIDKTLFFNRLSSFYAAWRADKRSSHPTFGGVGSIVILMGKTDEASTFQKNNAMHVCSILTTSFGTSFATLT